MVLRAPVALGLVVVLLASPATAATKDSTDSACFAAAERGQKRRIEGKLLDSHAELLFCAQAACPSEVSTDCARWLREVEDALPSVVIGARDAEGADLPGVRIFVDGAASGTTTEGRSIPLDPGLHRIRLERDGMAPVEQSVVLRAGEKNRPIVVSFAARPEPPRTPVPSASPRSESRPIPLPSVLLAGVGLAGLGVFTVAGLRGAAHFDEFGCDAGCSRDEKSQVESELRIADIGLVVGASALIAATVIYLLRPTQHIGAVSGSR